MVGSTWDLQTSGSLIFGDIVNKIIIFGSCNSYGLELWPEHTIPNYPNMDRLMAFLRDDFMSYADVVQNFGESESIKTEIEWCRTNAWPNKLKEKFTDVEILNLSIAHSNLANFIKLTSYLEITDIDKENTKIIIEVTEPTGIISSKGKHLKSFPKDHLAVFVGNDETIEINKYLDKHESARYRAYLDLLTIKNLISDLKLKGYDIEYFVWDRDLWYDVINNTEAFEIFLSYGEYIKDNFKKMFDEFTKNSLLTYDEEIQLKMIPTLPQGHYSKKAQDMLGTFIAQKIGDKK